MARHLIHVPQGHRLVVLTDHDLQLAKQATRVLKTSLLMTHTQTRDETDRLLATYCDRLTAALEKAR